MELLKLVIVDDEPILLEGLLKTYDWAGMGFEVVGSARDGDQAIQVIKDKKPNVVLTDIRMKKVSGLQVMQEIEKEKIYCLFVVLSAYRDFEYAKQACDLGAFAYLLKPINDDELRQTIIFIIKALSGESVITLKQLFEMVKEKDYPVVAAISKPYKGIEGIKKSYNEAAKLFELACMSGASAFTMPEELEEDVEKAHSEDYETMILNAIRRNDVKELKEGFIHFVYGLPEEEERQMYEIHRIMLKTESMLRNSYGITEELMDQYQKYYSNIQKLTAGKSIDVCYKILCNVIEKRKEKGCGNETKFFKEYMSEAVAYIEEHLNEEDLSIVSVANHVYLNSVYFGRIFKNTFHMTFKKYLMERRMERAKRLLEEGKVSIGAICEQVGIGNSSYFSHLFKEYTGKLPSEYKKEHDL